LADAGIAQTIPACPSGWQGHLKFGNDADLAVGRYHVLIADHDHIRVFSKCGVSLGFTSPVGPGTMLSGLPLDGTEDGYNGFFHTTFPVNTYAQQSLVLGDERAIFDPYTKRFVFMSGANSALQAGLYVAVSAFEDARNWPCVTSIPFTGCIPDTFSSIHLGSISTDASAIWFLGEHASGTSCAIGKPWVVGRLSMNSLTTPPFTEPSPKWYYEPAQNYADFRPKLARRLEPDAAPQYAIGILTNNGTGGAAVIKLLAINDGLGSSLPTPHQFDLPTISPQPSVPATFPQPTGGTPIPFGEMASIWSAVYRDGYLWAVHCVGSGEATPRSLVRWYKIVMNGWNGPGTPTPSLANTGTLDPGPGLHCFVPSITVNASGQVAVSYNAVGLNQNISIYSQVSCDPTPNFAQAQLRYLHPTIVTTNLPSAMNAGDYSGTVEDPVIPGRFWAHHGLVRTVEGVQTRVIRFNACGADFTGDGLVGGADVAAFGVFFGQAADEADFEPDEVIDSADAIMYQQIGVP
jgi:hypothetical protein